MKIVYISNSIIPSKTANSVHVMKMCQAFADNGHEVVLLAPDHKKRYEKDISDVYEFYNVKKNFTIKKLFITNSRGMNIIYTLSVFKYLLTNRFDLAYGRSPSGCFLASRLGMETIFESHAPMWERSSKLEKLSFDNLIKSKYFKKLVVISEKLKEIYLKNGYLNKDKISVAHDGADKVDNLEDKIFLKGGDKHLKIGYVGHLYPGKGIEVIEQISDKVSDSVEFHIVGGFEKDVEYWREKIHSKNVYFYGFVSQVETSQYINSFDICLLPNQRMVRTHGGTKDSGSNIADFTSPLKMFEYMAHQKPIIASDLPVLREVLDESIAILADPENPQEWISAIDKLTDKALRDKLSKNSIKIFEKYTWKNRAKHVL